MRLLAPLALALTLAPAMRAAAQTGNDRAFIALRATAIGALTPITTPAMISRRLNGAQLGIRYGFREEAGLRTHAMAASGIFGVGMASSVSLTAGITDAECIDCSPAMLLGFGGDMRVFESGSASGGPSLSVAVSGDFGYAQLKPGDASAVAFGIGAPVTVTFGATRQGMRIAPFVTPVFGIGSTSDECFVGIDCEKSGTRWVIGGGVGVWNPLSSISASVGINHVVLDRARPVFGVNVQIGGR
jgi:hypothetical protein